MEDTKKFLKITEISEYLNLSKRTIYRHIKKNNLPFTKIGGLIRFKKKDVDEWLKNSNK